MTNSGRRQIEWDGGKSVERVLSNGKRRYTSAFKAWIVEQCLRPGVSLAGIALANGLNANLVRKWVGKRAGATVVSPQLLPVRIEPTLSAAPQREGGLIEVQIHGARIQLHGDVDAQRLRIVLAALAAQA
ncbi:MAG: transposase [Comamonadaceae bacterium]|nr:MAG: transposase [Comamonadaceae bacterium]